MVLRVRDSCGRLHVLLLLLLCWCVCVCDPCFCLFDRLS